MKKTIVLIMVVGLVLSMAVAGSAAVQRINEGWEGYTDGVHPWTHNDGIGNTADWALKNGSWGSLTAGEALQGSKSYSIAPAQTSRIEIPVNQSGADYTHQVFQGWMYDTGNWSPSFIGLGNADTVGNDFIRIGDGGWEYSVQYYDNGYQHVWTGVPSTQGWKYFRVELLQQPNSLWEATWMIGSNYLGDYNSIGPGSGYFANWAQGSFTWAWARDNANRLYLGYEVNEPTHAGVSWDNVMWGSYDFVGAPVPEPGSLLVLGTGLAGLAGIVRRRRA